MLLGILFQRFVSEHVSSLVIEREDFLGVCLSCSLRRGIAGNKIRGNVM